MLLKCIECGNDVSEHADKCPNCGCPIEIIKINQEDTSTQCIIDKEMYDLTDILNLIKSDKQMIAIKQLNKRCGLNLYSARKLTEIIKETGNIPSNFITLKPNITAAVPKCPTCNSTNIQKISSVKRTGSILGLGILSKNIGKTFECKNCGYKW